MKKLSLLILMMILPLLANADAVEINGIYYNLDSSTEQAQVSSNPNKYSGAIDIPENVEYKGISYRVTSFASGAFWDCSGMTSINIPKTVWGITHSIFYNCSSLASITVAADNLFCDSRDNCNAIIEKGSNTLLVGCKNTIIPNSVTKIGDSAFDACSSLTSIIIPNSVTSIGDFAFYKCSSLTSITIPNSVTYMGREPFEDCTSLTSVTLGNGITSIVDAAFYNCSSLKSINIPNSVTSIGNNAFTGCISLTSINIPKSVTSIGYSAFYNCNKLTSVTMESKTPITISSSTFSNNANAILYVPAGAKAAYEATDYWKEFKEIIEMPSPAIKFVDANVKAICVTNWDADRDGELNEAEAAAVTELGLIFRENTQITSFDELRFFTGLNEIGDDSFYKCSSLTSVTIPDGVTSIGNAAFYGCSNLTSVIIPNSVTFIGGFAFIDCSSLISVNIPNCVTIIGSAAFANCTSLTSVNIPNSLTSIYSEAFYNTGWYNNQSDGLLYLDNWLLGYKGNEPTGDLVINDGTKGIAYSAFNHCYGLTSVTIPNGVSSIGYQTFDYCGGLTSVSIPNSVTSIEKRAFENCKSLTFLTIPNSVNLIDELAFAGCSGLTSLIIPKSVTHIGKGAFSDCYGLNNIVVESGNTQYDSRNDCKAIIETRTNTLIAGCKNTTIPNSVTTIGEYAFSGCRDLTSVTIPNSVTSIESWAFYHCKGLTSVTIPNSVTSIGNNSFVDSGWYNNQSDGLLYLDNWLLGYKRNKATGNLVINDGTKGIAGFAFINCSGLSSVTIPNSVISIGDRAFFNCNNLISIKVNNMIPITITEEVFTNQKKAKLFVPKNCGSNYKNADYWKEFKEIVEVGPIINFVDANVKAICVENWDTDGDGDLSEDEAAAVTDLGQAFTGNTQISSFDELRYFSQLTSIGNYAFKDCSNLTSVIIPNSVSTIGESSFHRCWALNSVDIPNSVISIGGYAFYNCVGLKSLIIPNSVTSIGASAFSMCDNLASITIPSSVTSIGSYAFGGTKWFNNQPDGLVYAGKVAYQYKGTMAENTNLILDEGTLGIAGDAFSGCTSLLSISLPNGLKVIGASAFYGCTSLTTVIAEMNLPISISEDVFPNRSNIALFVPNGCKIAYEAADYWKDFGCILEQGTVLTENNSIYAEDASVYIGYTADLQINMSNEDTFTAYQFDLVLPNGITLAKDEKGKYIVTLSNRHSDNTHQVTIDDIGDNTFRFVCVSLNTSVINGNDGTILTVSLKANNGIAEGELNATIKNVILTTADETKMKPKDSSFKIKTKTLLKGDADGDGEIDVTDVVSTINYIIGNPSAKFNFLAADLNEDGEVDIFDVMMAINLVFSQKNSSRSQTRATSGSEEQAIVKAADDRIIFGVNDASRFTAFQFDVEVTNGIELKEVCLNADAHHDLQFVRIEQDIYRIIGISMDNSTLTTNGNDFVELRLSKECDAQISNIVFVTPEETKVHFAGSYVNLTDIRNTTLDQSEEIFDLSGRKIDAERSRLPKGVYIINNKKVVKK